MNAQINRARIQSRRLVLVGSVLVDILMYIRQLPERGGDVVADRSILTTGGGFNVLIGATRLGLSAGYAGRVGDGPMGRQVMTDLEKARIPLLLPQVVGEDSGFDIGLVEPNAERTFVTSPGVESQLQDADMAAIKLLPGDAIYVSGYDLCYPISGETLGRWLPELAPELLVIIDPGPLVMEIPDERLTHVLRRTDILSLNARESRLLTGTENIEAAATLLVEKIATGGFVVARAGAQGCWVIQKGGSARHIPARATDAIDTTGAGDSHVAALLAQLAGGTDIYTAAQIANVAASISIERSGPATGPTTQELTAALTRYTIE